MWAHSGRELFFVDAQRGLVVAEVEVDSVFSVLSYETLFTLGPDLIVAEGVDTHDIGPNDERFLMLRLSSGSSGDSGAGTRSTLLQNWFTELREREAS